MDRKGRRWFLVTGDLDISHGLLILTTRSRSLSTFLVLMSGTLLHADAM